ncbi:hypothetical protein, partial [Kitasatospora sp. NPDC057198]|uniref:hypothetical protein n=1 Tax=Kitasatospora sp. NPDC057198 TaxID=3346046 RepID=UPI00362C38F9
MSAEPAPGSVSEPASGPARHRDHGHWAARFTARILVVCPRCGGRALVAPPPGVPAPERYGQLLYQEGRLTCRGCANSATWQPERRWDGALIGAEPGGSEDPFFRLPLWLQTRCAGRVLWAYDESHVEELAGYVGARLRERGPARPTGSMFARIPAWMKRVDNRTELLA